jgi:hypothetical protein
MSAGAAEVGYLEFGDRNISNSWYQFTVEEGIAIPE